MEEFSEKVAGIAAAMKVGDPLLLTTEAGAISSEIQLQKDVWLCGRCCRRLQFERVRTGILCDRYLSASAEADTAKRYSTGIVMLEPKLTCDRR